MPASPTVYLAGPDVFCPDAEARYARMERLCAALGLVGLRPSDGGQAGGEGGEAGAALAQRIYEGNVALIRRCDAVVANLQPFRGHIEPDSGTVFEVGVAVALGKPVAGYLPQPGLSYADRVRRHFPTRTDAGGTEWDDTHGLWIEGFGEPLNLMLSRSTPLFGSFEAAIGHLAALLPPRAGGPDADASAFSDAPATGRPTGAIRPRPA
ncbi:MAG: nucleoside 2-deoxyribosyltransferase [Burkholderiales bacterium]|nr:MAG: nucleoside 2-deoxyribosyltransferase [Burkholderiales bacterium]